MPEMGTNPENGADPDTFFGFGFEFSGKTGSGMYGMVYIDCKVHMCK